MMVLLNALTGEVDGPAKKPEDMSDEVFAHVEATCRKGRAYDVAPEMLKILDANIGNPDCFVLPSKQ